MPKKNPRRDAYHHGDLPRELVDKAIELLDERGIEGFSLREVARRAEVAVAAPSHHFGNVTGLLTAVAAEGFRRLSASFQNVLKKDVSPGDHVVGMCEAYIKHARKNPGIFAIMFRDELLDSTNDEFLRLRGSSLALLTDTVQTAVSDDASKEHVASVAKILWATSHGLASLQFKDRKALTARAAFAARCILDGANVNR